MTRPILRGMVGTALTQILQSIGITQRDGCHCEELARKMNRWGVEGCMSRRTRIATTLNASRKRWSWAEHWQAAARVQSMALALHLARHPLNPCVGLVEHAIDVARDAPDKPRLEHIALDNSVRHLTCHIWPVSGFGAWQWNCDRLLESAGLFNGRRIVAIAESQETDTADTVRDYLRDFTDEFIVLPNDGQLREVASWVPMLERLQSYRSPNDVTFSCHAKCVRHQIDINDPGSTIFRWTRAMYDTCLRWDVVQPLLETHGTVGSFRRSGEEQRGGFGPWHYSGTFYWWRNADVFDRDWGYVPQRFIGTEAWPGLVFDRDESACIVADDVGDLYLMDYWNTEIEPQLQAWRASHP